ncbi:MAG: hypothetical protein IJ545_03130 [Alphaproteobacteria bacterium]|nr:hypothetical protein [Alphaproteobacteria bacterium]
MKNKSIDRTDFAENNPRCFCADDDNCGCTYPENLTSLENCDQQETTQESFKIKTEERFIEKDSICYCTPHDCDCKIEYKETDY